MKHHPDKCEAAFIFFQTSVESGYPVFKEDFFKYMSHYGQVGESQHVELSDSEIAPDIGTEQNQSYETSASKNSAAESATVEELDEEVDRLIPITTTVATSERLETGPLYKFIENVGTNKCIQIACNIFFQYCFDSDTFYNDQRIENPTRFTTKNIKVTFCIKINTNNLNYSHIYLSLKK